MSNEILEKLKEHDKRFDEHDKRFDEHDKRFDEITNRLDAHDKHLDRHDKRFDQIDEQLDFLAKKSLNHDERLERIEANMATKADIAELASTLDELVGLARKKDQEVVFMGERVTRLEHDVVKIKPRVGL